MARVQRHLRMTEEDKARKVARQFARRLEVTSHRPGNMKQRLGNDEYWKWYNHYFKLQNGKCAICSKIWIEGKPRMHLDHDHVTFDIRGLLCARCNIQLGWFEKLFRQILTYLGYEVV